MEVDYSVIGARLKKARKEKNITQEELSEKLDISIAFLSRVERGNSKINLRRLTQICNILDISEAEILTGVSSSSNTYLDSDFAELLKGCSPETKKLIYNVAKVIKEENK